MIELYRQLDPTQRRDYEKSITAAVALSRLFSDNLYLNSKMMERAYCKYLDADNIALDNVPADAKQSFENISYGIGLKTFGINSNTKKKTEKIAEFDKLKHDYTKNVNEDAQLVVDAWNNRLDETVSIYNIDDFYYHCLTRCGDTVFVNEYHFGKLDGANIKAEETTGGFKFTVDNIGYSFNYGKSVLNRSFDVQHPVTDFKVKVFDDPFDIINKFYDESLGDPPPHPQLILPLFSYEKGNPHVFDKSGLNQWNASGRKRSYSEVYIPYNKRERDALPDFFPEYVPGSKSRKDHFIVHLPTGKQVEASRCQSGGKGIMSVDNDDFGQWLLFDVLKIEPGRVVTMDDLEERGINAVVFTKLKNDEYNLDFKYVDPTLDGFN